MALSNLGDIVIDANGTKLSEAFNQVTGAIRDLNRNYWDMRRDNTVGNDDYFHCKGNFEATQRGRYGEKTAEILGDIKENFDYYKNRLVKGLSPMDAYVDYLHDQDVNLQGRQQAKSGLYNRAKDACVYQRVRDINEKY